MPAPVFGGFLRGTRNNQKRSYGKGRLASKKIRSMGISSVSRFQGRPGAEKKSFDYAAAATNPGSDVCVPILVNGITAGTGAGQMVGRRAFMSSILVNYTITANTATVAFLNTYLPGTVRLLLIYDKAPQGAVPLVTDILLASSPDSPMNLNNGDRFVVLMDERHAMGVNELVTGNATYSFTTGASSVTNSRYLKVGLPLEGPSTAGGVAGINTGAIYQLCISSNTNAADNNSVAMVIRTRYTD